MYFKELEKYIQLFEDKDDQYVYDYILDRYQELEMSDEMLFCTITAYNLEAVHQLKGIEFDDMLGKVNFDLLIDKKYKDYMISIMGMLLGYRES